MNKEVVVQLAQEGDKEALRTLYEENKNGIFSLAYQYTKNREDAEDILQDTFVKAYHYLHKFNIQDGTSFSSWVYRIGINCSIDYLRRDKGRKARNSGPDNIENISSPNQNSDPERARKLRDIRNKIELTLNKLSPKQRMVFILRHYQQFSTKEIAEYLDCTEGSVKKQLFRAVSTIKQQFKSFFSEMTYEM